MLVILYLKIENGKLHLQWKICRKLLVVGRTECGKTTFIQNLWINSFWGFLKKVEWISGIELDAIGKLKFYGVFLVTDFHYPKDKHNFEELLEQFKSRSNTAKLNETDSTELNLYKNSFGKNRKEIHLLLWTVSLV